jgi:polyribonucleotide nucleotidyltransferase
LSTLDLLLAGTSTAVMMIEGYCSFLEDEVMVAAVELGAAAVAATAAAVDAWAAGVRAASGLEKRGDRVLPDPSLLGSVAAFAAAPLAEAFGSGKSKDELSASVAEIRRRAAAAAGLAVASPSAAASGGDGSGDRASSAAAAASSTASSDDDDGGEGRGGPVRPSEAAFNAAFKKVTSASMRSAVLDSGVRSDGRAAGEVRPIAARAGLLPRAHGSALFTRGETQAVRAFFEFLIFFLSFFLSRVERRSREGRRRGGGSRGGKNLSFLTFKHEKKTSSSPSPRSAPPPRRSASTP